MRNENVLLLSFRQKKSQTKPVLLLTTKYKANTVEVVKKRKNGDLKVKKPDVITKYNMYMGGTDTSDQMLYCYLDERCKLKYWRKVAFNMIARMILNSYILYKENNAAKFYQDTITLQTLWMPWRINGVKREVRLSGLWVEEEIALKM